MELRNVALYCKYWYDRADNKEQRWKDLSICIACDGWVIRENKQEVVRWILNQFDEHEDWFKKAAPRFGIAWFLNEVNQRLDWDKWSRYPEHLDYYDAIILVYMSVMANTEGKMFDKKYFPDPRILPLNLAGPEIKEYEYWRPAEMQSEYLERIHSQWPDHIEQTFKYDWEIWNRDKFDEEFPSKTYTLSKDLKLTQDDINTIKKCDKMTDYMKAQIFKLTMDQVLDIKRNKAVL